jgi:hypothetical protein
MLGSLPPLLAVHRSAGSSVDVGASSSSMSVAVVVAAAGAAAAVTWIVAAIFVEFGAFMLV